MPGVTRPLLVRLWQAADIRTVLTALLENIADVLKDQAELKPAAVRLTQPKSLRRTRR
jgi:hypothetical protein